jgi:hypothetical protein
MEEMQRGGGLQRTIELVMLPCAVPWPQYQPAADSASQRFPFVVVWTLRKRRSESEQRSNNAFSPERRTTHLIWFSSSTTRSLKPCLSRLTFSSAVRRRDSYSLTRASHLLSAAVVFWFMAAIFSSAAASWFCALAKRRSALFARIMSALTSFESPGVGRFNTVSCAVRSDSVVCAASQNTKTFFGMDVKIGITFAASSSPSFALSFRRHVVFVSAYCFTLLSNLSNCRHRWSNDLRISFSFSVYRASASLTRFSKSCWIWLRDFNRLMRLSWKTPKFVYGFVSAWPAFF